jgi:hypothetical protein
MKSLARFFSELLWSEIFAASSIIRYYCALSMQSCLERERSEWFDTPRRMERVQRNLNMIIRSITKRRGEKRWPDMPWKSFGGTCSRLKGHKDIFQIALDAKRAKTFNSNGQNESCTEQWTENYAKGPSILSLVFRPYSSSKAKKLKLFHYMFHLFQQLAFNRILCL